MSAAWPKPSAPRRSGASSTTVAGDELVWSTEFRRIVGIDEDVTPTAERFVAVIHPDDVTRGDPRVDRRHPPRSSLRPASSASSDPTARSGSVRARGVPEVAADGAVVRVVGHDDGRHRAGRGRTGAPGGRDPLRDRLRAVGDRRRDRRSRRHPRRVNPAPVLAPRPCARTAGRPTGDRLTHPDERAAARGGGWPGSRDGHDTYEDERRYVRPDGAIVWASVARHPRARRGRRAAVLLRPAPGHHRAQADGARARPPGAARLAHRPAEPGAAHRPARPRPGRRTAARDPAGGDVPRRRPVQGRQRLARPHRRRRPAAARRRRGSQAAIRPGDTVARFGGDEFVVVCDDVSARETEQIAERVLDGLAEPLPDRRPGDQRHRQPRHRHRRRRRRRPRACCATPTPRCTGPRSGAGAGIELFDETLRAERRTAGHGVGAAPRPRARRVRRPLPADRRPRHRRDGQRRGAAALAAPRPRADRPGRVHPAGRGDRPDRPDRRLGAGAGLPAARRVAAPSADGETADGRGQPLGAPAARARHRRRSSLMSSIAPACAPATSASS